MPFLAGELLNFLKINWNSLLILTEFPNLEVTVQVVSNRQGSADQPHGYSLSEAEIKRIAELGAALDIDVIGY